MFRLFPLQIVILLCASAVAFADHGKGAVGGKTIGPRTLREESFSLIHPAAPHYSTLLRVDPGDGTGTRVVGDLAESWTVSKDFRTYTFRLRAGVRFHDGSELTARGRSRRGIARGPAPP